MSIHTKIKLSDYVFRFVADLGVKHVFTLVGGGSMHLVDSLGKCSDIEYVCNLHEQASAIAAEAYGQYTNNLGVALVTTGPGGTNTVTGVAGAYLESTPCLFISGQVKRSDLIGDRGVRQMGSQEIDIISIVKSITKYAVTVIDPTTIRYHLEKAVHIAKSGRPGPVWIDIPLDVQAATIDQAELKGFDSRETEEHGDHSELERQVSEAIRLLNEAERPVFLAGAGIRLAKAEAAFRRLVEALGIPVLTTWKAIDFLPESHPLFAGRPGAVASRGANFCQQNADWLATIGARLDFGQTGYNHANFARAARKVMVDVDPAEIRKMEMPIDVPVCADAGVFIEEFLRQMDKVKPRDRLAWLARCAEWKRRYPVILPEYWEQRSPVNPYVLIDVLSDELTGDDVIVPGSSGQTGSEIFMQSFRVKAGQRIFNTSALGSMGFGLPASIGACLASGRKRTICVNGDGGFHLNIQELETIKRLNLPIKLFVLNNGGYVSIRFTQRNYFGGNYVGSGESSGLTLPDIVKIATAYGLATARIDSHNEIRQQVREVLETPGPVICEVIAMDDLPTAPRMSSAAGADGSMVSKPLEDLWPFLGREEFRANMIISSLEE
ncbi:MAG: thiamine pyrophosphate-binding protein [Dehalococcoidia bacterium]|nr:thiamine pyrophosphate-binding protein [Dehalococcoidia bacterium]